MKSSGKEANGVIFLPVNFSAFTDDQTDVLPTGSFTGRQFENHWLAPGGNVAIARQADKVWRVGI